MAVIIIVARCLETLCQPSNGSFWLVAVDEAGTLWPGRTDDKGVVSITLPVAEEVNPQPKGDGDIYSWNTLRLTSTGRGLNGSSVASFFS